MKTRSSSVNGVHYSLLTSSCRGIPCSTIARLFDTSLMQMFYFQVIIHIIKDNGLVNLLLKKDFHCPLPLIL